MRAVEIGFQWLKAGWDYKVWTLGAIGPYVAFGLLIGATWYVLNKRSG